MNYHFWIEIFNVETNRHHFALFIRNCRLIMLLRREHVEGDLNTFRPAEWRWKLPQVSFKILSFDVYIKCSSSFVSFILRCPSKTCEDEWHHFAISMSFPDAQLYIDGQAVKQDKSNPEVIDDWPLHPAKDLSTTYSIGACWQSSESKFKHHFRGYMAGLSLLTEKNEDPKVLSCLHKCKESLEVPGMEVVQPGMQLMTNTGNTQCQFDLDLGLVRNLCYHKGGRTFSFQIPKGSLFPIVALQSSKLNVLCPF